MLLRIYVDKTAILRSATLTVNELQPMTKHSHCHIVIVRLSKPSVTYFGSVILDMELLKLLVCQVSYARKWELQTKRCSEIPSIIFCACGFHSLLSKQVPSVTFFYAPLANIVFDILTCMSLYLICLLFTHYIVYDLYSDLSLCWVIVSSSKPEAVLVRVLVKFNSTARC